MPMSAVAGTRAPLRARAAACWRGALAAGVLGLAVSAAAEGAPAGAYPQRPLRFVVPFPPGGGADNLARIVGQKAAERLGEPLVVDNRAGAGGNLAAEIVARTAPDGYTLLQVNVAHAIGHGLRRGTSYDLIADFAPVTHSHRSPSCCSRARRFPPPRCAS